MFQMRINGIKVLEINLLIKRIRAQVIKEHLQKLGQNKCVCFTCGNAAKALKNEGLEVIEVGSNGILKPNKWFDYTDIQQTFGVFDATSGHLPMPIMVKIAKRMRQILDNWHMITENKYFIPTGSGESLVIMAMAYPRIQFYPIRFNAPETKYDDEAPLNTLVTALSGVSHEWAIEKGKTVKYINGKCMHDG